MISYNDAKKKIEDFVSAQPEEFFAAYGKTRESVVNDAVFMKKLVEKYVHQVRNWELDPDWALQNAFDVAMTTTDRWSLGNMKVYYLVGNEIVVTIQGPCCKFRVTAHWNVRGWDLKQGDLYIAKRNTGWQLAKCHSVDPQGWVNVDMRKRIMYPYNCNECHKVKSIDIIPECGTVLREADGYVCPHCGNNAACNDTQLGTNRCMYAVLGFAEWDLKDLT